MTKDLNPQQYKQMMNYLTRPKKKPVMNNYIYDGSKNAIRSEHEIREEEINKDPNMLRRIKYYVETYDNVSQSRSCVVLYAFALSILFLRPSNFLPLCNIV